MPLPTGSSLGLALQCIGPTVLPRVDSLSEAADKGSAKHLYLEHVPSLGPAEALMLVDPEYRKLCEAIDLDSLPLDPNQYDQEVTLAYNVVKNTARILGRGLGRDYSAAEPGEFVCTVDVISKNGAAVYDYKTGQSEQDPLSAQMMIAAVATARIHNLRSVASTILRIPDDGLVYPQSVVIGMAQLNEFENRLRGLLLAHREAAEAVNVGNFPRLTTGNHCTHCPSLRYCPAQTGLVREMAGLRAEDVQDQLATLLDPDTAAIAWHRVRQIKAVLGTIEQALHSFAAATPIDLGNGRVLGPVTTTRESIDGSKAYAVLAETLGAEVADAAVERSTSKAAIERAIKQYSQKGEAAGLNREALHAIRTVGAISVKRSVSVTEHKAEPEARNVLRRNAG